MEFLAEDGHLQINEPESDLKEFFESQQLIVDDEIANRIKLVTDISENLINMDYLSELLKAKKEKFDLEQSILASRMKKTHIRVINPNYQESLKKVKARIGLEDQTIDIQTKFKENLSEFRLQLVQQVKDMNSIIENIKKEFNNRTGDFFERLDKFMAEIELDMRIQTEKKQNHSEDLSQIQSYIRNINSILEKIDEEPINKYDINIELTPDVLKFQSIILKQGQLNRNKSQEPKQPIPQQSIKEFLRDVPQDEYIQKSIFKEDSKIRFERDLGYDRYARYGVTGTLPKEKISHIRISVIQQYDEEENWYAIESHLIGRGMEIQKIAKNRDKIRKSKLQKTKAAFHGVIWSDNDPLNLQIGKKSGKALYICAPINIHFDPQTLKVIFESEDFQYNADLIKDEEYRIAIGLCYNSQIVEVEIMSIE